MPALNFNKQFADLVASGKRPISERVVACLNACAGMDDPVKEIARLRDVEHHRQLLGGVINDMFEGIECEPDCDSYAHSENCRYANGELRLIEIMRKNKAMTEEIDALRAELARAKWEAKP